MTFHTGQHQGCVSTALKIQYVKEREEEGKDLKIEINFVVNQERDNLMMTTLAGNHKRRVSMTLPIDPSIKRRNERG
jgi:hypothetical protein